MKRLLAIAGGGTAALLLAVLGAAWLQLDALEVGDEFGLDADPREASRVYSRPLSLETGRMLGAESLEAYLLGAAYLRIEGPEVAEGEFSVDGRSWQIGARAFSHSDGSDPGGELRLRLSKNGRVSELRGPDGQRVRRLQLEPARIGAFHAEDGRDQRKVSLDAIPRHLIDAVLAIEDQRFLDHQGIDPRRIAGAVVANLRAGRVVQGGSTLTQQLVKNLYLSRERSWFRKLQEAPLAILLELRRSKQEILEAYLNEIYLGQDGGVAIHGVGRAAEHWFGQPVETLALHESALLAGMLRGPSLYSPRRDPEMARARRDLVLSRMHVLGKLDDGQLAMARAEPLDVVSARLMPRSASYFADGAREEVLERYPAERLGRDGLRILTTLDLRLQRIAEQAVKQGLERMEQNKPALVREGAELQAALVALDPRSGHVLAMVGGRDYGRSQFNRATEAKRQPGSVFKAVGALAALTPYRNEAPLYTLATLVEDAPFTMETPEGDWQPGNHDNEFRGPVTLRQVVEQSLNVPMIRVGIELGPRRIVRAARRLGIESRLRGVPSLVLGTSEVTLLEMTRAFAVLAAEGWRAELREVVSVLDATGEVLEHHVAQGKKALNPAEAHLVTSVLEGVVNHGTGFGLRARGFSGPVAGKTGTTDAYRDAWFIGYVPELTVGVWVGFDDGETLRHSGSGAALPIFADFLLGSLGPTGGKAFQVPAGVERMSVVAALGHRSGLRCGGQSEVFLAGTGPEERCNPFGWFADHRPVDWWSHETPPVGAPPEEQTRETEAERESEQRPPRLRLPGWLRPIFGRVLRGEEAGVNR